MKTKSTPKIKFNLGDRVRLDPPQPSAYACEHGVIVRHHGRKTRQDCLRVRWVSGWGTSVPASELIHLTPAECACLPEVSLCAVDLVVIENTRVVAGSAR